MSKVIVRTKALSQTLYGLAVAGCDTVEVSAVTHAVKVEGIREDERLPALHVWSTAAEETEAAVGKGERTLTKEEIILLDEGKCPICEEHYQLFKGPWQGLAIIISCDAGHLFWVPPPPYVPEYLGQLKAEEVEVEKPLEEQVEEALEKTGGEADEVGDTP